MGIKITIPNTSSDVLTFGSGNTPTAAQIAGIDSGSSNGQLALYTTASGTSTERMRIDASGNVGIGTSSPSYKLHVVKGANDNAIVIDNGGGAGDNTSPYLSFAGTNGGSNYVRGRIRGAYASATAGGLVFETGDSGSMSERARIDSSGNLLVGTATASLTSGEGFKFFYNAGTNPYVGSVMSSSSNSQTNYHLYSTGAGAYRFYVGLGGTVYATITTITGISDQRLKENIRDLDDGLDKVMALQPRKFDWKEGKGADIKNARGFIAQEFETVFPDLIDEWKDPAPEGEEPYKSVRADLIPTLVKAIQEQQAIITSLTDRLTALENK